MIGKTEIVEQDGFYVGPVRRPVNRAAAAGHGSIHDDATAQKLGFRGGTIAGSIHMDQFPPVLLHAFGSRWFESGSLSLAFKNATISDDPVVGIVAVPRQDDDVQVAVRMEQPDATLVAEGTASLGRPSEPTHLSALDLRGSDGRDLRLLAGIEPGHKLAEHEVRATAEVVKARIDAGAVTEPLPWYTSESPWGGSVVNPSTMVQLLRNRPGDFGAEIANAVGLFGAIELRQLAGPMLFDAPYVVAGEVIAVGSSPKTEYVWYDTTARDTAGTVIASMRMQLRWMKASSPLYATS